MARKRKVVIRITCDLTAREVGWLEELLDDGMSKAEMIRSLIRRERAFVRLLKNGGKIRHHAKDGSIETLAPIDWLRYMH